MKTRRRLALGAALLCATQLPAGAAVDRAAAASSGARWIVEQQKPGGAFFSGDYPAQDVAEAIASVVAGGVTGAPIDRALAYVAAHGPGAASEAAYAARIVLGLVAAGRNPRAFGGYDYVARLESFYSPATGAYDTRIYADALAILGVVAARSRVPAQAMTYVRANQCPDGGYGHDAACASGADADTTALVLIALTRAGVSPGEDARSKARDWLHGRQESDGGFALSAGDPSNANSTGLALSAIAAIGENALTWRSANGSTPVDALSKLQLPGGGFAYLPGETKPNAYATVQAVPGIAGLAFPILPRPVVKGARIDQAAPRTRRSKAAPASVAPTPASALPYNVIAPPAKTVASGETAPQPVRSAGAVWLATLLVVASAGLLTLRVVRR